MFMTVERFGELVGDVWLDAATVFHRSVGGRVTLVMRPMATLQYNEEHRLHWCWIRVHDDATAAWIGIDDDGKIWAGRRDEWWR